MKFGSLIKFSLYFCFYYCLSTVSGRVLLFTHTYTHTPMSNFPSSLEPKLQNEHQGCFLEDNWFSASLGKSIQRTMVRSLMCISCRSPQCPSLLHPDVWSLGCFTVTITNQLERSGYWEKLMKGWEGHGPNVAIIRQSSTPPHKKWLSPLEWSKGAKI